MANVREEFIAWFRLQEEQIQQELIAAKAKKEELEAFIKAKEADLLYIQTKLESEIRDWPRQSLTSDYVPESIAIVTLEEENYEENQDHEENEENEEDGSIEEETENPNQRNPKDMFKPEFFRKTLGDAALIILDSCNHPLNSDQITKRLFDYRSEDEYQRAKNSLSTELRRGAKEGRWKKIGRGFFAGNSFNEENN
ncbi:MAG TPA: hypothetical protein V6D21_09045 [Candidatus Obscuribacterales bacterium]